jgi:hypothetical protein
MPIPIKPVGNSQKNNIESMDYSFLLNSFPKDGKDEKRMVVACDKDASMLLELWSKSEKMGNDTIKIGKDLKLSSTDIIRLKSHGLITGGSEEVKLTNRGKAVITTMALGENNNFLKSKKEKSYTEILASIDKRGKKGYRIPKISLGCNLIRMPKD